MHDPIPRSATRRGDQLGHESRPLAQWSDVNAYVLLAEPGGGKTEAFLFEAEAKGYVLARDFANAGPPEGWCGEPLFIDGFDQMRTDSVSQNAPLDHGCSTSPRCKNAGLAATLGDMAATSIVNGSLHKARRATFVTRQKCVFGVDFLASAGAFAP